MDIAERGPAERGPAEHPGRKMSPDRDVYTVSRLNREVRVLLERGFGTLWLEAEISNFARPSSGHWYFSLKDAGAQVRCAMFRQRNMLCAFAAKDGQKVLVRARIGLYEPRGEYQLIIDHMEDAGLGALKRQFEELSAKLEREGLFAAGRKRPVPSLPRRIGVVTSPTGAAVRDILHVLARRFPAVDVLIYPVPVQGAQAAGDIIAALRLAGSRAECDVLILARGGGSLEDLWAFNDEGLARAIVASPLPIITGIGHEVDFTIADFAADVRAPTPTAAAELLARVKEELVADLATRRARLLRAWRAQAEKRQAQLDSRRARIADPRRLIGERRLRLDKLQQRLEAKLREESGERGQRMQALRDRLQAAHPAAVLHRLHKDVSRLEERLKYLARRALAARRHRFEGLAGRLDALSPLRVLARGYAVAFDERGHALLRSEAVGPGDRVRVRLHRGELEAEVTKIAAPPPDEE